MLLRESLSLKQKKEKKKTPRGKSEHSPALPQIMQPSLPRLGTLQGQHIQSTTDEPHTGKTTFMFMVSPLPGKYWTKSFYETKNYVHKTKAH